MKDGDSKNSHSNVPELVSVRSQKDVDYFKVLQRVASQEFVYGSFADVLARSYSLLGSDNLLADGVAVDQIIPHAQNSILDVLKEGFFTVNVSSLPTQELVDISSSIGINIAVEQWFRSEGVVLTDFPDLPGHNIKKHIKRFRDLIWGIVRTFALRETVEFSLRSKKVYVHCQDTTRLLIYGLNKDCIIPHVLVIPNDHKPYNPYLVALIHDVGLPADVARFLRCFNR